MTSTHFDRTANLAFQPGKVAWNLAWQKRHGKQFEIVIDPDKALAFKASKGQGEVQECLHSEHVFTHAQKGERANEQDMLAAFGTNDPLAVARVLILEGEIQLTSEYRESLRDAKRKRILDKISTYAIDPTTGYAHPRARLELAFAEAKIRIDEHEEEERQVAQIVRQLQPIIPIRLETVTLQIHLPHPYGQKLYGDIQRAGNLKRTEWAADGALLAWVELPAGLQSDLMSDLGKKSHGAADIQRVDERRL
jgi:ribosome maturation protein SDO1